MLGSVSGDHIYLSKTFQNFVQNVSDIGKGRPTTHLRRISRIRARGTRRGVAGVDGSSRARRVPTRIRTRRRCRIDEAAVVDGDVYGAAAVFARGFYGRIAATLEFWFKAGRFRANGNVHTKRISLGNIAKRFRIAFEFSVILHR